MVISVDSESCNRCGTCSTVCPMGIISPPSETSPPLVRDDLSGMCLKCGHCEAFCPTGALLLSPRAGRSRVRAWVKGDISPETLEIYLKSRRSIRQYRAEPVDRATIIAVLDIARYAASGRNAQSVEWLVLHDPGATRQVASLSVEWLRTLASTGNQMSYSVPHLLESWEKGNDVICRGAPHLIIAHVPEGDDMALVDATIALTHVDIAAPAFGIGTCWAGFVTAASHYYAPLREFLAIPSGRVLAYAMMLGYPRFKPMNIPEKKPLSVTWR